MNLKIKWNINNNVDTFDFPAFRNTITKIILIESKKSIPYSRNKSFYWKKPWKNPNIKLCIVIQNDAKYIDFLLYLLFIYDIYYHDSLLHKILNIINPPIL
jgi:hypothetical protein